VELQAAGALGLDERAPKSAATSPRPAAARPNSPAAPPPSITC
jgi:hypothetical protein